jgi:hypothetical protein
VTSMRQKEWEVEKCVPFLKGITRDVPVLSREGLKFSGYSIKLLTKPKLPSNNQPKKPSM